MGLFLERLMKFILLILKLPMHLRPFHLVICLKQNVKEAAHLEILPVTFPWKKFPWQKAIYHFARLLGSVHIGNIDSANDD